MKNPGDEAYEGEPMPPVPPMELEATSLMLAAKAGDRRSFDELVAKLRGLAFQIAHGFVGSREDALDLSQEAFLKVYRARASFRDGEPFLPWFHRILRNTCFSHLRKHKKLRKHSLDAPRSEDGEGEWTLPADLPAIGESLEREELGVAVRAAIEDLSDNDREILVLRHFQELSYKEIAHVLELKEGTVMSRLFHARRRLRDRLAKEIHHHVSSPV